MEGVSNENEIFFNQVEIYGYNAYFVLGLHERRKRVWHLEQLAVE